MILVDLDVMVETSLLLGNIGLILVSYQVVPKVQQIVVNPILKTVSTITVKEMLVLICVPILQQTHHHALHHVKVDILFPITMIYVSEKQLTVFLQVLQKFKLKL